MTVRPAAVPGPRVAFRPLRREDFGLLAGWLAEPLVARWWAHETSAEAVERDFGSSVDGREPTQVLLAGVEDRAFGLVQRYRVAAYPQYEQELAAVWPVPAGALSIDYLIGVPSMRGRGLGAAMIAAVVTDCWRAFPDAGDIVVPVAAGNTASWRALERAGFTRVGEGLMEPDDPREPRDHVVYRVGRPRGPGSAPAPS